MKIELRKSRKNYKCDYSHKKIPVNSLYKRVNINYDKVYHFHKSVSNEKIINFLTWKVNDNHELNDLASEYALYRYNNDMDY